MPRAYIGVGSNIDPEANIPAALRMLAEVATIVGISTFYRTPALGPPSADASDASGGIIPRSITAEFINGVVAVETDLPPRELKFGVLRPIERVLGRVRDAEKFAPRTIDLDIAVYGDVVIDEPDLVIPDPGIMSRAFLAMPLAELAPELFVDAVRSQDAGSMTALDEFTQRLRREIVHEP